MSAISVQNLTFAYEKQIVLQDISLQVKEKDFLAIIGPNGGGKSTLLKLILGINKIQKGTIKIFEQEPSKKLSLIGYVPQNTNINIDFPIRVIDVVLMGHIPIVNLPKKSFFKKALRWRDEGETACAMGALGQVGMEEYAYKKIGSLSGGQRQRVMIARALCAHPKILLLDEPTASIDVDGQKQIYDLLKVLNKSITIVVVTHDISVVLEYASKVAHINKKLTFHDVSYQANFQKSNGHFCEVEMMQMLGAQKGCSC